MTDSISEELLDKESTLKEALRACPNLAVAYSGGVDSTYLADVAHEVLGDRAVMVTADSPSLPRWEFEQAIQIARERGWRHEVLHSTEFTDDAFLDNDERRCYYCKAIRFKEMWRFLEKEGIKHLAHGENADDLLDTTRVGRLAAEEQHAIAPLKDAGITKEDARKLSKRRKLATWDKPPTACLATRIPTGQRLDPALLTRVEAVESVLKELGFSQFRARHHGDLCRIEIPSEEFPKALEPYARDRITQAARNAGYRHVSLDLGGYRMGNMAKPEDSG